MVNYVLTSEYCQCAGIYVRFKRCQICLSDAFQSPGVYAVFLIIFKCHLWRSCVDLVNGEVVDIYG